MFQIWVSEFDIYQSGPLAITFSVQICSVKPWVSVASCTVLNRWKPFILKENCMFELMQFREAAMNGFINKTSQCNSSNLKFCFESTCSNHACRWTLASLLKVFLCCDVKTVCQRLKLGIFLTGRICLIRCMWSFQDKWQKQLDAAPMESIEVYSSVSLCTLDIILQCAFSYSDDVQRTGWV
jgi:hypothetical protein